MTGLPMPASEAPNASNAEPLVPISVDAVGEAILDAIEETDLVNPGLVPLIDASTTPEAIASNRVIMAILEVTTVDDAFTAPAVAVGLTNETTNDTLAVGLADPITGELFAVGVSSELVRNGAIPDSPRDSSSSAPVYVISGPPQSGLAVFILSGFTSNPATGTPAIVEPGLEVPPGSKARGSALSSSSIIPDPTNIVPGPSAELAADQALLTLEI